MEPMKRLVFGLRKFDVERTNAALGPSTTAETAGYMSPKAKIYLVSFPGHALSNP
jgi:hypothetical protein